MHAVGIVAFSTSAGEVYFIVLLRRLQFQRCMTPSSFGPDGSPQYTWLKHISHSLAIG